MTDVVIVDAIRTPIGALGGILAPVRPDDLAALVIKSIIERNMGGQVLASNDTEGAQVILAVPLAAGGEHTP